MKRRMRASKPVGACLVVGLAAMTLAACGSSSSGTKTASAPSCKPGASAAASGGATTTAPSAAPTPVPSGMPGAGKPPVTLGDKNFTEEFILGDLYQQALQARGYTVNLKPNIGSSELIDKSLTSGQIDMYPEYSGVVYQTLAGHNDIPKTAAQTYQTAVQFEAGRGFTYLQPTPFQDADRIGTTKAYAAKHCLVSMGDLKNVGPFTYGGPPENGTRFQGVVGMKQSYGLNNTKFVPLPIGSQYTALDKGQVDTIAIFTTDGQLISGKYAVLTDPNGIFGFQQVAPVVKNSVLAAEGPEFAQTLNAVSATLTDQAIQQMNAAVSIDHQDSASVAKQFLQANHLI